MKKLKITQTNQPKKVKSFYEFTEKELIAKQIYDLYYICIDMLEIFEDSANLEAFTTEIKLMEQAGSYQPLFDHTAECFHNEIQKIINQ